MTSPPRDIQSAPDQLRSAAYANQRAWLERIGALDASGQPRPTHSAGETIAVRTGLTGAILLPGDSEPVPEHALDALAWLRHNGSGDVLIWSGSPNGTMDHHLSAYGAQEGFEPLWMSRDLRQPLPDPDAAADVIVRPITDSDLPRLIRETAIPYSTGWQIRATHRLATAADTRRRVRVLIAEMGNRIVGRAAINLAHSPLGPTAGIYDLAVHPEYQRRGIGAQLTGVALRAGRELGARFATLNSTPMGEKVYRAAGFEPVGRGQTWFLPERTLRRPPSDEAIRFAMMISGGETIPASMRLHARAILPNGDTPLAHAARFKQADAARQLLAMGTAPDIAALWQLGLQDEARVMMDDPLALNARRGPEGTTPLHLAICWRDDGLLTALLAAGANPRLRDKRHGGDAWGWARALGNETALRLLNERFPDGATGTS